MKILFPAFLLFLLAPSPLHAHAVPRSSHDRTIVVRLTKDAATGEEVVLVHYRLEVDELTVVLEDMDPFKDQVDYSRFRNKPNAFYAEFTRCYAPVLAGNLVGKMNGKPLEFTCVQREHRLHDDQGQALGHLRCDFVFRAAFEMRDENEVRLREGNYELQTGKINLTLLSDASFTLREKTEPDEVLKNRPEAELRPGDEEKLRQVAASFRRSEPALPAVSQDNRNSSQPPEHPPIRYDGDQHPSLFRLFLDSEHGFVVLLILSAGLGAIHALTPGHGKTLVAAYLVGEQGTVWHAVLLGVVTTLTHTGAVLLFALGLQGLSAAMREQVLSGLELGMGLLVACMGFWLLLQRLSGRADHIHLGGHSHHHHHHGPHAHDHSHADHDHDAAGSVQPRRPMTGWGLIVLGMSGGMVPCLDAVALLLVAVGMNLLWLAVPMLLAFSAGLAGVLVLIGILVVQAKNFARSHWGEGRLVRSLPLFSAAVITAMGLWLCYHAVHAERPQPTSTVSPSATGP